MFPLRAFSVGGKSGLCVAATVWLAVAGSCVNGWITAFGGFRFVEFNELLAYTATPGGEDPFPLFVRSFNDLYGFQVGSDITLWDRGGPFRAAATGKAGIYGNYARNRADDEGYSGDPDYVDSASKGHAAFLGEIEERVR